MGRERCGRAVGPQCAPLLWSGRTGPAFVSHEAVLEFSLCHRNPALASDEITDSRVQPRLCDPRGETSLLDPGVGTPPRPLPGPCPQLPS